LLFLHVSFSEINFDYEFQECSPYATGSSDTFRIVGCDADGVGPTAQFYLPTGVAVSKLGTVVYVADTYNSKIRKISCMKGAFVIFYLRFKRAI